MFCREWEYLRVVVAPGHPNNQNLVYNDIFFHSGGMSSSYLDFGGSSN